MVIGAASHRLLGAEIETASHRSLLGKHVLSEEAVERQRILSELEEVHQLRERMLQEGVLSATQVGLVSMLADVHRSLSCLPS